MMRGLSGKRLKLIIGGIGILSILVLGVTAWIFWPWVSCDIHNYLNEKPFDSTAWKADANDDSVRVWMVDDLLSRYHLVGMSKKQVADLLGKPDSIIDDEYRYTLGLERGMFRIDYECLVLEFGKTGKVTKAYDVVT